MSYGDAIVFSIAAKIFVPINNIVSGSFCPPTSLYLQKGAFNK